MKNITILLAAVLAFSCNTKKEHQPHEVEKASWFIGDWENPGEKLPMTESWTKVNDSVYSGVCVVIKDKDTFFHETIELKEIKGKLHYIAQAHGQNDDKPVAFGLTTASTNDLVFENPQHDYPTKIHYRLATPDSLVCTISGTQQGKPSQEVYGFRRKKI